jgi:hypothetical protein
VAQIVLVHGIAQENRSADDLEEQWCPSLAGGVRNAGDGKLADRLNNGDFTVKMAFYGDIFLTPDHMGLEPDALTRKEQLLADEIAMDLLRNAVVSTNKEDARAARIQLNAARPDTPGAQGARTVVVRAAGALDRIPWFGRGTLRATASIKRTLAQVTRYLEDPAVHDYALGKVNELLGDDTRIVIGHSLGSVVAYDAVRARLAGGSLPLLLTLGSPLGLSAIREKLRPKPPGFPAAARKWVNIASPDDIVAARRDLQELFNRDRPEGAVFEQTWKVANGSKPHQIEFYLTKKSCGTAVASALESA